MADGAERREARRFNMSLPMRVLPRDHGGPELKARTRDVSYRGLYFVADTKFEITLPQQVAQAGDVNIRCQGQIVRVEKAEDERVGIAAKIERYEFLPTAA